MRRIRVIKRFLAGMGIWLCLVSMAHTAWAGCEQRMVIDGESYFGGTRGAPLSLAPSGLGTSCGSGYYAGGYYTAFIESIPAGYGPISWANCGTANPEYWIYTYIPPGGCGYAPFCTATRYIFFPAEQNPTSYDYDCDETPDIADQHPGDPSNRAKEAGVPRNGACPFVGNPTNVATGNKFEEALDLSVPSPGLPIEIRRSYNSQVLSDGPLGYGWSHSYDLSVQVVQESAPKE